MSNRDPDTNYAELSQALQFVFRQFAKLIHTAVPGIVRSYNPDTKRASVQIGLNKIYIEDGEQRTMARPVIQDVPAMQLSAGGLVFLLPVKSGTPVWLMFSERGIETFKKTFDVADPPIDAIFAERDAVFLPGFGALDITPVDSDALCLQTENGSTSIAVKEGEIVIRAESVLFKANTINDEAY